jgi:MFS family permease
VRGKLLLSAASAATGGLGFGFQVGVISGALLFIRRDFGLTGFEQGALVGILPLGAMAGGLLAGRLAEGAGRRGALIVAACAFIVGTGLAVGAPGFGLLLAGRAVTGVAVGVSSSTVPVYLAEIAPPDMRGRLVTLNQLMITTGIVVSYLVDLAFASSGSWRAMLAVGFVPAALLLAGMMRAPETRQPGRERAEAGGDQLGARELLGPAVRPALLTGITLAAVQQLSGINAVIYYAPSIMEKTGLSASNSILYSVVVGAINVAATVVSFRLVDRTGRRPLLLSSLGAMLVSLALLGLTFALPLGAADSWLSLICLVAYIAAFAVGLGPIFWLLIAEIFPAHARAAGASASTAANWFWNFVVGLLFLPLATAIGEGETFWVFGAVCALGLVFVQRFVPETKGRSFDEIDADVRERWHSGPAPRHRVLAGGSDGRASG